MARLLLILFLLHLGHLQHYEFAKIRLRLPLLQLENLVVEYYRVQLDNLIERYDFVGLKEFVTAVS